MWQPEGTYTFSLLQQPIAVRELNISVPLSCAICSLHTGPQSEGPRGTLVLCLALSPEAQCQREYMAWPEGTETFTLLQQPAAVRGRKSHRRHVTQGTAQQTALRAVQDDASATATILTSQYLQAVPYLAFHTGSEDRKHKEL